MDARTPQLITVPKQPNDIADAVRVAYVLAGGGSSKSAAVAGGAFADALEYLAEHSGNNSTDGDQKGE